VTDNDFSRLEKRVKDVVAELKALRIENRRLQNVMAGIEQERAQIREEKEEIRRKVNNLLTMVDSLEKENDEND